MRGALESLAGTLWRLMQQPWAWVLLAVAGLAAWLNSRRGKGQEGEAIVRWKLRRGLPSPDYQCLHGVLLPAREGETTEVDHIVCSCFGIFVMETKNWKGWIKGTAEAAEWRVFYGKGRKKIRQNPVRQNAGHIRALAALLELPLTCFHNVVYMAGEAELKDGPLPGVVTGGLADYIKSFRQPLLDAATAADCAARIAKASLSGIAGAKAAHVARLRDRRRVPGRSAVGEGGRLRRGRRGPD